MPTMRRRTAGRSTILTLFTLSILCLTGLSPAAEAAPAQKSAKPTVVLVHGAFADASGWNRVSMNLQDRGYTVIAPANPLRGLDSDAAYIRSVLQTIDGPMVVVGHSYGGMVMTKAASGLPDVKALVYIAAFAPDTGDSVGSLSGRNPGTGVTPENLTVRDFPGGQDGYIKESVFREVFAADLPKARTEVMAASQRPSSLATLAESLTGPPAWATVPSWYLVANQDKVIPPATQREMAKRAKATTVRIDSSHVAMMSHHGRTTSLILEAARSTD